MITASSLVYNVLNSVVLTGILSSREEKSDNVHIIEITIKNTKKIKCIYKGNYRLLYEMLDIGDAICVEGELTTDMYGSTLVLAQTIRPMAAVDWRKQ